MLMQWVKKNPLANAGKDRPPIQKDKNFKICKQSATNQKCDLCDDMLNKLNDFAKVKDLVKHRQKMSSKKLCFKCLKSGHCIVDGVSRTCFKCNHCASTISCRTTPAKKIKSQKKKR